MSTQEFKKFRQAIKDKRDEISNDKEKARNFLFTVGVLTKTGKLKKEYKDLCILEKQD